MKKKITIEELEKRVAELEKNRIVYIQQPNFIQPYTPQCTCNTPNIYSNWCPLHGYKNGYVVTC